MKHLNFLSKTRWLLVPLMLLTLGVGNAWATVPNGWTQVTALNGIAANDKIIIVTNDGSNYLNGSVSSKGHFSTSALSSSAPASASAAGVIQLESTGTANKYKLKLVSASTYITASAAKSGSGSVSETSDSDGWTFSGSNGAFDAQYQKTGAQANLRSYNNSDFRTYSGTSNGATFQIYKYSSTPSYTITAQSNNTSYGTVSGTTTITASPKNGYRISVTTPYTVTSGTATVVRGTGDDINKFTVTPTSNCTVRINFEAIPTYTLNYHDGDGDDTKTSVAEGTNLITALGTPAASCDATSTTFVGWTTSEIATKTNTAPTFVAADAVVNSTTAAAKYWAVYAKVTAGDPISDIERGSTTSPYVANTGWTASANGTYTTSGNYGNSSPSIKFANSDEYVQSPTYSNAITGISFWYKPQNASGTIKTYVSANGTSWTELTSEAVSFSSSSTAGTKNITVSSSSGYKAVKIVYSKTTSNVAIDDISITYSNSSASNYLTTCCTELAQIKGSFFVSHEHCAFLSTPIVLLMSFHCPNYIEGITYPTTPYIYYVYIPRN